MDGNNAVGTYISTQSSSYYDEGSPYQYDVKGKTASLLSEIIYENRLKPFTLSVDLAYTYKHTMNNYQGDVFALNKTDNNKVYAFGEIKGESAKSLSLFLLHPFFQYLAILIILLGKWHVSGSYEEMPLGILDTIVERLCYQWSTEVVGATHH